MRQDTQHNPSSPPWGRLCVWTIYETLGTMQIDGDLFVGEGETELALLRALVAWLKERGARYDGWIGAYGDEYDISGTFDMPELEAELETLGA